MPYEKKRWDKAFQSEDGTSAVATTTITTTTTTATTIHDTNGKTKDAASREDSNCKATIVIEHILQASDVSHTMQHWHVYQKWNETLFHEMYKEYLTGRTSNDPTETWYQGELGFFHYYIIPLAKKLKECGVF